MIKPFATLAVLGLSVAIAVAASSWAGEGDDVRAGKARQAVKALGESLKGQLMSAIKAGGPVSAIAVCRTAAPALGAKVSSEQGLTISRTALRVRNPKNAPDAWERKVLEDFITQAAAGADPATLERGEEVTEEGVTGFRYMKAIPMAAEPCLACHGSNLAPAVATEISKLYPEDQATGFKVGDVRGAFSVRVASPAE